MMVIFKQVLLLSAMGTMVFLPCRMLCKGCSDKLRKTWIYRVYLLLAFLWIVPYWALNVGNRISFLEDKTGYTQAVRSSPAVEYFRTLGAAGETALPLAQAQNQQASADVFLLLLIIWFAVMAGLLMRLLVTYVRQIRTIASGCVRVETLEQILEECRAEMGIRGTAGAYINPKLKTPVLLGLVRGRIVLPNIDYREEELRMIFRHELVHLQRKDNWVMLLANIISCVHWFNPAAYLLKNELAQICEDSCDELVAKGLDMPDRKVYSFAILNVTKQIRDMKEDYGMKGYLGFCDEKGDLKMRIQNILHVKTTQKRRYTLLALILIAAICLGGGVIAAAVSSQSSPYYTESVAKGMDEDGRPTATLVLVTEEGEIALADYHTDSFDGIWNEDEQVLERYMAYLPAEWLAYDPNPKAEYFYTADGVADSAGQLLENGERVTYFAEDGAGWELQKGDTLVISIAADKLDAQWPSQGEIGVGYNVGGSNFDLLEDINVIRHFQIEDKEDIVFQAPSDGVYSFTIECFASEALLIKDVQIAPGL